MFRWHRRIVSGAESGKLAFQINNWVQNYSYWRQWFRSDHLWVGYFTSCTETFTAYKVTNARFSVSNMAQREFSFFLTLQIPCIEGLETLTTLEVLDLSDNNISRIRNLKTLTRLKKVNLSANYIGSIECLTELTNVRNIEYNGNQPIWSNTIATCNH